MQFSVEEIINDNIIRYRVRGYVNEAAIFPPLRQAPVIRIDLGEVIGLNSIGTRNWCDWIARVKAPESILVERCPVIFIKSFNNVVGALPANMHVVSFYVPFVAPSDGARTDVLVTKEQVSASGKLLLTDVKDAKGELLEADVLDDYYRFAKR